MDGPKNIQSRALDCGARAVTLFRFLHKSRDTAGIIVAKQYLRSATSIGANLEEADAAETKADFIHKCSIAQKEARECLFWLRLMAKAEIVKPSRVEDLVAETNELVAVITSIGRNARKRSE